MKGAPAPQTPLRGQVQQLQFAEISWRIAVIQIDHALNYASILSLNLNEWGYKKK